MDYDIIILTETWLCSEITDGEIFSSDYTVFRLDRDLRSSVKARGGGVLIAVRSYLLTDMVRVPTTICEELYVSIRCENYLLICGAVYIPPNSSIDTYLQNIASIDCIQTSFPDALLCIAGDYNLPNLVYSSTIENLITGTSDKDKIICDSFSSLDLIQYNRVANNNDVILDLILSSIPNTFVKKLSQGLVPIDSHHPPLLTLINLPYSTPSIAPLASWRYNFKNANYSELNDYFSSLNWNSLLDYNDINSATDSFYSIIFSAIDICIPKSRLHNCHFPAWYKPDTIKLINKKRKTLALYRKTSNESHYNSYRHLRSLSKTAIKNDYKKYLTYIQTNLNHNTKIFYSFINSKSQNSKSYFPKCMNFGDTCSSKPKDIANMFANFFKSVYNQDVIDPNMTLGLSSVNNNIDLHDIDISIDEVKNKLLSLKSSFNPGPDGIPSFFLTQCASSLAWPIWILYCDNPNFPP